MNSCHHCGFEGDKEHPVITESKSLLLDNGRLIRYRLILCPMCHKVSWEERPRDDNMNDVEHKRWMKFQEKHEKTRNFWYECYSTGIGEKIVAVAKYRFKSIKEDITDYDCW